MRKLLLLLCVLSGLMFFATAVCAEEYDGYIFEPKHAISTYSIFSSNFKSVGDGIYAADSLEDIYNVYEPDELKTVYPNYRFELFDAVYPETTSDTKIDSQWNLKMIKAESARRHGTFGKNVKVAVLDSGLDSKHTDFEKSNILPGYNCVVGAIDTSDTEDIYGHGTMVTSIISSKVDNGTGIAGIASKAKIIPIKITDSKYLNLTDIYAGIDKAIELDADIINLSLGGALTNEVAIAEFKKYIDKADNEGILMIAAGGNSGTTVVNYPAGFDNVIGVGFVNSAGNLDSLSHKNDSIFITAPGSNVPCLTMGSTTGTTNGSSIATPHVTSAVAIMKQLRPNITLNEVKEILSATAIDKGSTGYDTSFGHGILNIEGVINTLAEYLSDVVISQGMDGDTPRLHIHNNAQAITADAYFVSYDNNRLLDVNLLNNTALPNGVTTLNFNIGFDNFYLWTDNLMPLTDKFTIEK